MNRLVTFISLLMMLAAVFSASAQQSKSWEDRSPYEVTIGTNIGTKYFTYNEYSMGSENDNLLITNTLQTPSVNLGVTYKLSKRITFGAIATYAQSDYVKTATYDNSVVKSDRCSYISLAPRVRFDWINGRNVTLYSSFALGVGLLSERDRINGDLSRSATGYVEATYLGVKVGRTLFGFADLSSSSTGAMRIGIGYNFKPAK